MVSNVCNITDKRRTKMERIPKEVYTQEFRAEAIRLIEGGQQITEVSYLLSVPLGSTIAD